MKHILAVVLLLLPLATVCAKPIEETPNALSVSLSNIGSENCVLANSQLMVGTLKNSSIPQLLPATGKQSVFHIVGPYERSHEVVNAVVSLTYNCGAYKKFTLYLKQYYKSKHYHGTIDVEMRDVHDVFESHQVTPPVRAAYKKNVETHAGKVSLVVSN